MICFVATIFSGCSATSENENALTNGTYTGIGAGYVGDIKVEVTMTDGEISNVEIISHEESLPMGIEEMPMRIVEQGLEAELVTGATISSKGIIEAVKNALESSTSNAEDNSVYEVEQGKQIIIVGGGNAGLNAALHALENGASVVLFEKQGKLGGTFGGGTWIATGSKMQLEQGIDNDSASVFKEDVERLNHGYQQRTGDEDYWINEDLTTYFGEEMGEVTDLMDDLGVNFGSRQLGNPTLYEPHSVMRVLSDGDRVSMTTAVEEALSKYEKSGQLQIVLNANVDELIMEEQNVTGVKYTLDGAQYDYKAVATILATGGYGYNPELISRAGLKNYTTSTPSFQTGDGYVWAEEAGAVLKNMDFITVYGGGLKEDEADLSYKNSIRFKEFGDLIYVNKDGERFVDEFGPGDGSTYDAITTQWKIQEDNVVYIAVSQNQIDSIKARGASIIARDADWSEFERLLEEGNIIFKGDSAEDAAKSAGIDADAFARTIERYNGFVDAGKDEDFGRSNITQVRSHSGEMIDLERDTFTKLDGDIYLIKTTPYIMICAGGVDVNTQGQALNSDREPIKGLFISGEMVGMANAFGRTTIGGIGNTGSAVWGKMAGVGAANYVQEENQ